MLRRNLLAISVAVGLIGLGEPDVVVSADPTPFGAVFYVSPGGNDTDGTTWTTAWIDMSDINWAAVPAGATIVVDGGSSQCSVSPYDFQPASPNPGVTCGQRYSPLSVGQNSVTIVRSTETGKDGTVVIDGGRDTPLPYCYQTSYSAISGAAYGIDFGSHSGVTIDGRSRSGIVL